MISNKEKIAKWQVKIVELAQKHGVSLRRVECVLKRNFDELDWRSLLTSEMIEFADKDIEARQATKYKYQSQKDYFDTDKGRKKLNEAQRKYWHRKKRNDI